MAIESHTRGHVNTLRNSATAVGSAGLGFVASRTWTRQRGRFETMRDADDTSFCDTIAILGKPEWRIPIGLATFLCEVSGHYSQQYSGSGSIGEANAKASFAARAFTGPRTDWNSWCFPPMARPQHNNVLHVLSVTVVFFIGEPIYIASALNTRSREASLAPSSNDLAATVEIRTVLRPIIVEGVSDPMVVTCTNSETKYYAEGEAMAEDVPLRSTILAISHA